MNPDRNVLRTQNLSTVLISLALIGCIALLLYLTYTSQIRIQNFALDQLRQDSEKRAEAVSYFYMERRNDLRSLAEQQAISNFFENQALGMSLKYGLRDSIFGITDLFREFVNKKSLHERRIYDGLFYMNEDGTILTKFTAQELGEFDLEQLLQTLRKRAEEALRESEARLLTLINATPDIICFKDARGAWILANSSILDLYQIKGVDYQDKTEFELADPYGADLSECLQNLL